MDKQDIRTIDTVVIGGGQAGLRMSYVLQEAGREHVVLEKGRALEQWRSAHRKFKAFIEAGEYQQSAEEKRINTETRGSDESV